MTNPVLVHDVEWNTERVNRFWDNMTHTGKYFSDAVGDSLIELASRTTGGLNGRILDYGCGPGILLEKLLKQGAKCEGADTSPDSLEVAARRLKKIDAHCPLTLLQGVPSSLPDNTFGVVFFVETIEHVLPKELPQTLAELQRIVRPGGHVIVSTPHNENLNASKSTCPECGARYHKMQHVSSWTSQSIATAMEHVGWQTVRSKPTLLPEHSFISHLKSIYSNLVGRKQKHLVYIGQKPIDAAQTSRTGTVSFRDCRHRACRVKAH